MKIRPFACLLTALLLPPTALAAGERLAYTCDNGSRFDLDFSPAADGRPQASLHFADDTVTLPQVPAASGALYRAGDIRLHTQGDEAQLEDGQGNRRLCKRGDTPPPTSAPAAPSSFLDIAGSVAYRSRQALPPDAVLVVRIVDQSRGLTLAEQRSELAGRQVPIPFAAPIDRDLLGKKSRVVVSARIERRGQPLFVSDRAYPALRDGQPQALAIQLKPVKHGPPR